MIAKGFVWRSTQKSSRSWSAPLRAPPGNTLEWRACRMRFVLQVGSRPAQDAPSGGTHARADRLLEWRALRMGFTRQLGTRSCAGCADADDAHTVRKRAGVGSAPGGEFVASGRVWPAHARRGR